MPKIKAIINDRNAPVSVQIGLSRMPENCGECPFYVKNVRYDEEAFFGDGMVHSCPFGCSHWGCLVTRPNDCPLRKNKE